MTFLCRSIKFKPLFNQLQTQQTFYEIQYNPGPSKLKNMIF
ncbi:hypothetical protein NEISICOT_01363 [Neisseria sicca ATCC 29256]|uniref:Uncharacterized protein n=1 Tax=Neisseria sicca ATCC 29256 TaxID=547045 RepID=C6M4B7_NEISI|nr:hypothetical protein NEISICOT_01363 [Neisseria sicca ATCC 29256]